jgi:DNA-directed RNA polymerase specialized sigma24 family protein
MAQSRDELLDLLARALAGNKAAEEQLFIRLTPSIREGVVCALFLADVRGNRGRRGPADVEDFVSKTYIELLENDKAALRSFSPAKANGNLEGYVCRIAQRVTFGELRLKKSGRVERPTAPEDMPDPPHHELDPEMALLNRDLVEYVLAELKLNEEATELFFLHFIDGLDGPEICELTEWTLTAFWKWASRVREKCRRILGGRSGKGGAT